jgi:hypothetical protein
MQTLLLVSLWTALTQALPAEGRASTRRLPIPRQAALVLRACVAACGEALICNYPNCCITVSANVLTVCYNGCCSAVDRSTNRTAPAASCQPASTTSPTATPSTALTGAPSTNAAISSPTSAVPTDQGASVANGGSTSMSGGLVAGIASGALAAALLLACLILLCIRRTRKANAFKSENGQPPWDMDGSARSLHKILSDDKGDLDRAATTQAGRSFASLHASLPDRATEELAEVPRAPDRLFTHATAHLIRFNSDTSASSSDTIIAPELRSITIVHQCGPAFCQNPSDQEHQFRPPSEPPHYELQVSCES